MGHLLLVWRLVRGDIKRRRLQSALLVITIMTSTATLTLALALHGVTDKPFARARAATRGPDIAAMYGVWGFAHPPGTFPRSLRQFKALSNAPGVRAASGPYPLAFPQLAARGYTVQVFAEGRGQSVATVDQPVLTAGRWIKPDGVVIESSFADALGVRVGASIRLGGRPFRIVGEALTTSQSFYPHGFGVIWLTLADVKQLEVAGRPAGYALSLRLDDPAAAPAFAAEHAAPLRSPSAWQAWSVQTWEEIRAGDLKDISLEQGILLTASWLMGVFAVATIAVLVGGRMAEQTRRVGLLKAVGGTPRLITVILLAENLLLALVAATLGLTVGRLIAPTLTSAGNGLIGSPAASPLTISTVGLVASVAIAIAGAATIAPALRAARTSTLSALNDPAHLPRRRPRLIALSAHLPVPLLFGMRLLARRTRRGLLAVLSLTIAAATVVAALTVQHHIQQTNATANGRHNAGMLPGTFAVDRVNHVVLLLTAILIVLAAINTIITTWATVLDAERATALARALGATPRQITAGLATAQLFPALLAAGLGIPLGLELYRLAAHGQGQNPPTLWLLATIPATLLLVAGLTALPARIGAKRPAAEVLRSD